MHLTLHTDYALRVLIRVGMGRGDLVTVGEIAEVYGISKNHLTKVVHRLGRAGYLETVRGKFGGVRLLRPAADVRIGDFVRDIEKDFALTRCMAGGKGKKDCLLADGCLAQGIFGEGMAAFFGVLDRYTLADILARTMESDALGLACTS